MTRDVSLLHPLRGKKSGSGSDFPSDLFELTRSRLRLIAGFVVVAFGLDLLTRYRIEGLAP